MDFSYVSEHTVVLFEGKEQIAFSKYSEEANPNVEDTRKKVVGILLEYAYCGEQDFGIERMAKAFSAEDDGIIKKVPNGLTLDVQDGVAILRYGYKTADDQMIKGTKKAGILGYWDDENLMICASSEYSHIIESLIDMIQPNKARFAFQRTFAGSNLLVLTI